MDGVALWGVENRNASRADMACCWVVVTSGVVASDMMGLRPSEVAPVADRDMMGDGVSPFLLPGTG